MNSYLERSFATYSEYHRDPVNIAIHKVCVPVIVFSMLGLADLARLPVEVAGVPVSLGQLAAVLIFAWYLCLSLKLALVMAVFSGLCLALARVTPWWGILAAFVLSWAAQLAGHRVWEKRKPAFADDLRQLLIGPLYFLALVFGDWRPANRDESPAGASR